MQSKQYFTKIKNYPHEKSTEPLFGQIYEIKPTKVIVDGSDTILSLYNKAFVEVMVLLNLDYMDIKR